MKATEHIFERGIKKKAEPDAMQHGFMPGKKITDGIFVVWQMQKKHGIKDSTASMFLQTMKKLECGQMPNVMVALPNTGGAFCSTPQSLADTHYWSDVQ